MGQNIMSFIYNDTNLLGKLISLGQDQSQNADMLSYMLAKPLLVNLQRQIDPSKAPPVSENAVGVAPGAPTDNLSGTVADFRTLGDFLQWAADKKLTWNGKRFAWSANEQPEALAANAWEFASYPKDRSNRDVTTRAANPITAYASKPELVAYLTHLRDDATKNNNKVLQVMLGKIISEVNVYLRSANEPEISTKPAPEVPKLNLDPNATVDGFPDNILDLSNPMQGIQEGFPSFTESPKKLLVKDLSDIGSFQNWIRGMEIKLSDGSQAYALDPVKGDPCSAIYILYKRAQYLSTYAAAADKIRPGYSQMASLYLNAIKNFGGFFKGKNGESCVIVSPNATGEKVKGDNKFTSYEKDDSTSKNTQKTEEVLEKLIQLLPLSTQDVDFNRIDNFFQYYLSSGAVSSQSAPQIESIISNVHAAENKVSAASVGGKRNFPMRTGTNSMVGNISVIREWAKPPQVTQNADTILRNLHLIVSQTSEVIRDLYNSYGRSNYSKDRKTLNDEQIQLLVGQITTALPSNLEDIETGIANLEARSNIPQQ